MRHGHDLSQLVEFIALEQCVSFRYNSHPKRQVAKFITQINQYNPQSNDARHQTSPVVNSGPFIAFTIRPWFELLRLSSEVDFQVDSVPDVPF